MWQIWARLFWAYLILTLFYYLWRLLLLFFLDCVRLTLCIKFHTMKNKNIVPIEKRYKIQITYDTGGSDYHATGVKSFIEELSWDDLNIVKQNLKYIEEHYIAYCIFKDYNVSKKKYAEVLDAIKNCFWFEPWSTGNKKIFFNDNCLNLKGDNGEKVCVRGAFWCGYFETFVNAEIVDTFDSDMKVEFDRGCRGHSQLIKDLFKKIER